MEVGRGLVLVGLKPSGYKSGTKLQRLRAIWISTSLKCSSALQTYIGHCLVVALMHLILSFKALKIKTCKDIFTLNQPIAGKQYKIWYLIALLFFYKPMVVLKKSTGSLNSMP